MAARPGREADGMTVVVGILRLSRGKETNKREISTGLYIPRRLATWDEGDPWEIMSDHSSPRRWYTTASPFVDHDPGNMRRDRLRVLGPEHKHHPLLAPRHAADGIESPEEVGGFCDVACAARGEVLIRLPDAGRRMVRVSPVESLSRHGMCHMVHVVDNQGGLVTATSFEHEKPRGLSRIKALPCLESRRLDGDCSRGV